jgi:hypothetical protein
MVAVLLPASVYALDSEDSQMFIAGFNSYQKKDFPAAIEKMTTLLNKYPDTPLRDMAIFWLSRSSFKAGQKKDAAKYMAQFFREYPDSPLKTTVEEELATLAHRYEKGEPLLLSSEIVEEKKVAAEKAAAEKAAAEKAAAEKAAAEKVAAEKVAAEKVAAEKVAAEKVALLKADQEKLSQVRIVADKERAEKEEANQKAEVNTVDAKVAQDRLATEKKAAERAEQDRIAAAEKIAVSEAVLPKEIAATKQIAPVKEKVAAKKKGSKGKQAKGAAMRDKAIAEYKGVIDRFPGTTAAAGAEAKLKQMGVDYPTKSKVAAVVPRMGENAQILNLEVAQHVEADLQIGAIPETVEVGRSFAIPLEVVNLGNGPDSFYLESGFPKEYNFHFAAQSNPDIPVNSTPDLASGEKFRVVAIGSVPRGNIDGQINSYQVKITSKSARDITQSKEIRLTTTAPLLRAVVKTDKLKPLPGEKITYRIALLNIGAATARGVTFRLNYPPQFEPSEYITAGFKQEMNAALVLDGQQLKSGESREFNVVFQLKHEALAHQELFLKADIINSELDKKDSFLSGTSIVQGVSGVSVKSMLDKLVVIPGQTVAIPLVVTNTGNQREDFIIKQTIPGTLTYTFFQDLNRDGKKQENEPVVNHIGPLTPKEEAYVVLQITTALTESDGTTIPLSVNFLPESDHTRQAGVDLQLICSRPVLELSLTSKLGKLKPGEVSSMEMNCVNRGSNLAKQVELHSEVPPQLELLAEDPAFVKSGNGTYTWRFDQLGAGEKRSIKVTYRVKAGIAVGTSIQLKNVLKYQDQLGNAY